MYKNQLLHKNSKNFRIDSFILKALAFYPAKSYKKINKSVVNSKIQKNTEKFN
jgi:hypothetical protein